MKKGINPIENKDGVVLAMVLLVLMATIVIGIFLARTSFIETRIAGNEAVYKKNLYLIESASDWAMLNNSIALSNISTVIDQTYTYTASDKTGTGDISDVAITVRLTRIGKPRAGLGYDPSRFKARYYDINTTRRGHTILLGAYRVFPAE
jgi:hypothetical protein